MNYHQKRRENAAVARLDALSRAGKLEVIEAVGELHFQLMITKNHEGLARCECIVAHLLRKINNQEEAE